jgi:hypothetical protein
MQMRLGALRAVPVSLMMRLAGSRPCEGRRKMMRRMLCAFVVCVAVISLCASAAAERGGWQTYHDSDYGFAIDYPTDMRHYSSHPVEPPELSMFPLCRDATACFQYDGPAFEHTGTQAAGVSVNILRGVKTEAECGTIDTRSAPIKTIVIHGKSFVVTQDDEAGGGSGISYTMHRTFYQHVCFDVTVAMAYTNLTAADDDEITRDVDPKEMTRILDEMERMLHSFRFTGPVKDGPDWKVYSDNGCGHAFEYPAGAILRKIAEFSGDSFNSPRIACEQAFSYNGRTYRVAVKVNLKDVGALNMWLTSSGYPDLTHMKLIAQGDRFTQYSDGTFTYIFSARDVFIFTVTDEDNRPISTDGDRIFTHLLGSFTAH